ncbi:GlxA family transcriptional regulator [Larsenimonas suaedae]|uniref:GlxA family transcriptional regulator n=1 Tax=Larsenimonas suaedae TaxID=1851019 RepID=A0ABU1GRP2_9GAMM|nr:GlxA family transcriptional regulator [Larsenimonas suaedae]MCM2972513.1 GlxA family transcriptional regulator [Larsenimonas suaedae]MDR5894691.1 GlxA family transcriptional regulator [Larsenimonas suaedae]
MHRVALFVFDECQLLDASGPWQVFATANELLPAPAYQLILVAEHEGPVTTNSGMVLHATAALGAITAADTLLIAGGSGVHRLSEQVIERLATLAAATARVGSICTGAFALARTGRLDGYDVTTHWRHASTLARQFPALRVRENALYLEQNNTFTSAGITAGIDLTLSLIERDHGTMLACRVARELVVFLHRPGDQAQFSEGLNAQLRSQGRLRRLIDRILSTPESDWRPAVLADELCVTPRHLTRLFKQATGTSPGEFVIRARLDAARRLLIDPALSMSGIATRCGLGGAEQLRRHFTRHFGVSPSVYRARFGARTPYSHALSPREGVE